MAIHFRQLDERSFSLSGSNIVSSGVATQSGYYVVVDPTVINNLGGTPGSTIAAGTIASSALLQTNFDPSQAAADFTAANWISKGWNNPSDLTSWRNQVRDWLTNNLTNATLNPGSNDINFYLVDTTISGTRYLVPIVYLGADGPNISVDADAQAFFDATGITDATQKSAIGSLVSDLKSYSLWAKMKAVYPFVGGTATTHKYNLIDPRDLDAAFRLTFSGTWAHSSSGAAPDTGAAGTNSLTGNFANTFLKPSSLSQNDNCMGFYTATSVLSGGFVEMGIDVDGGVTPGYDIGAYWNYGANIGSFGRNNDSTYGGVLLGTSQGMFLNSRTSSTTVSQYHNGSLSNSFSSTSSTPNNAVYIAIGGQMASSNTQVRWQTSKTFSYAFLGDGLNATDVSNLYTAVQAFQTTLGRQV